MYKVADNGVFKKLESWHITMPLHDNDNMPFDEVIITGLIQELLLDYPGFSIINTLGYWKGEEKTYTDRNQEIIIDVLPDNTRDSTEFFAQLKLKLQEELRQEKIYITKESDKDEFLSFNEFFNEVGIESTIGDKRDAAKRTIEQLVGNLPFVLQRLGYETTMLRRNTTNKKIVWERKLCGVTLRSEFDDYFPSDIRLVAADQLAELGDAMLGEQPFAVIGGYEFQFYILDKSAHRALVNVRSENLPIGDSWRYISPEGEPLTVKRFIEEFTMSIITNCIILREEGYMPDEIRVNVGRDGSLQSGSISGGASTLLSCPAIIPQKEVQLEILRCLEEALRLYETNSIDPIALMMAKAKNRYFLKRAFVRKILRENRRPDRS